ncbi:MAG: hypothetical protein IPP67_06530 [Rhodospirillaceae bacterium]|nr:hypothetical protein [Rhodospirillaceae bacterium]
MLAEWKYLIAGFVILDLLTVYLVIRYVRERSRKNSNQSPALSSPRSSVKIKVNPLDHTSSIAYQESFVFPNILREDVFTVIGNIADYPKWREGLKKVNILSTNPLIYEETAVNDMVLKFQEVPQYSKSILRVGDDPHLPGPLEVKFEVQQIQKSHTQKPESTLTIFIHINLLSIPKSSLMHKASNIMFQKMIEHWVKNFGAGLQKFLRERQN